MRVGCDGIQYRRPVANTAITPTFRFGAMCKCHIAQMGRRMISTSEKTLMAAEMTTMRFLLTQSEARRGFQVASIGWHSQRTVKKTAM